MSAPFDQQRELAAVLTAAGLPTDEEVPARFSPPRRYVIASEPWIEAGQTIGSYLVHFRVVCVTGKGTNEKQMDELGGMVRAVIRALKGTRFYVEADAVGQPSEVATGAGVSLGAAVNVATGMSRAEFEGA